MTEDKDVFNKLVVNEKDTTKEMAKLVDAAARIFRIEKPSGRIIFQNFGMLKDKQRIIAVLVGKYFATKIGITQNSTLSISEIANELGRPMTTLSGPMRDLIKQGLVEIVPGRKYKIAYHRLNEVFEDVLLKTK